jgi:small GTP-binding protein
MKKLVIGILAHVDAGKTTLAESLLYLTGSIRKLGRVDHKDAFLDTFELERARGITIFSKQAELTVKEKRLTLLDTPGHVDFSSEMERTLQVLDYAILVISGSDGVQGHTETLWRLLTSYGIPTFLFVNKMDLVGTDHQALMEELKHRLSDGCVDFRSNQDQNEFIENLAVCDDTLLDSYIESGKIEHHQIVDLIKKRKIFPVYFGSALKLEGVEEMLSGLDQYTTCPQYPEEFGAKVYKISRDDQGNRLTHMKITGGSLKVKMLLTNENEKVDQIRIYSGVKYETTEEVSAGAVCAVTGLSKTYPGHSLGFEELTKFPLLEPVLSFQIILPPESDVHGMLLKLRQLEEEDPLLHIMWNEQLKEIHVQLMGEVQIEVLKKLILDRFGVEVEFSLGNIVYKETIKNTVEGVGHFEPLRHYAEVHLLLEPGEAGSGLVFDANCSEDDLDRNWQRLIITHLEEKEHVGVLTGSPITDMKITLVAGRAHQKHTEGGDFRQATYRAVRQGLRKAQSVLLEPFYHFKLELPSDAVGRAMSDIQRMCGVFQPPEIHGDLSILVGSAPVATMRGYQSEVTSYTKGRGRLLCSLKGYEPCHNSEEVIATIGYECERDLANPTSSVFCAHGAGFVVEWDRVEEYMHVESGLQIEEIAGAVEPNGNLIDPNHQFKSNQNDRIDTNDRSDQNAKGNQIDRSQLGGIVSENSSSSYRGSWQTDKELEAIFTRTFGPIKQKFQSSQNSLGYEKQTSSPISIDKKRRIETEEQEQKKEYLLVDGYNILFAWEDLKDLAKDNLEAARNKLMDILCNYQGFKKCILILVFDAYKVKGNVGEVLDYHNIHVVYTKEAETADMYIEKVTHEIGRKHHVTVATSDGLEQIIIMGQGAARLSATDLKEEVARVNDQIRRDYLEKQPKGRNFLGNQFNDEVREYYNAEDVRARQNKKE